MKIMLGVRQFKHPSKRKSIPLEIDAVIEYMQRFQYQNVTVQNLAYIIGRTHRSHLYEPNSRQSFKAAEKLHQYLQLIGLI